MDASCSRKRKRPLDEDDVGDEIINVKELEDQDCDTDDDDAIIEKNIVDEAIEAQEPATHPSYGDIQLTPFNMDDELEEGEFDRAGNFVYKKKEKLDETNNDSWAESIDWSRVKDPTEKEKEKPEEPEPEAAVDPIKFYKQMLRIMKYDETVQKTIRRLGNDVPKRRPNKNKFKEPETPETIEARAKLNAMIEFAHRLLENGDVDIYQKSYEDLEEAINS